MRVGIALGSNMGDRAAHLQWGIDSLRAVAEAGRPFLVSAFYETEPVDCPPGSPAFVNAAIEFSFSSTPQSLLAVTQKLEAERGRQKTIRNAPRPLDLDILYCGDTQCRLPSLEIPHPRIASRLFVLVPLCDIAPDRILPGQDLNIRELCNRLKAAEPFQALPTPLKTLSSQ